jgi:hypothetical protein
MQALKHRPVAVALDEKRLVDEAGAERPLRSVCEARPTSEDDGGNHARNLA